MDKIYCLYKTGTSEIRYIGKTRKELPARLYEHLRESRRGKKSPKCNWIRKVGYKVSIKLIRVVSDNWQTAEKQYIAAARSKGMRLLNIADGGNGASGESNYFFGKRFVGPDNYMFGRTHTPESRALISASRPDMRGEKNPMFGKPRPEALKEKLRAINKGKTHSPESKAKISNSMSGEKNPFFGKAHSEETRSKLRKAKQKQVVKIDPITGEELAVFPSLRDAQASIPKGNVQECCSGKNKSAGGFIWKYKTDSNGQ